MKRLHVLVFVIVLSLIVVALGAVSVATAAPISKPVSWTSIGTNSNNYLFPTHVGMEGKVQKLADGTLTGHMIVKGLRVFEAVDDEMVRVHGLMKLSTFTSEFWHFDQADFYRGTGVYEGADIAEFVAYLSVEDMPVPSVPFKFQLIDFGEPGKTDLFQWWVFQPWPTPSDPPTWVPENVDPVYGPTSLPLINGNIQVHVGG